MGPALGSRAGSVQCPNQVTLAQVIWAAASINVPFPPMLEIGQNVTLVQIMLNVSYFFFVPFCPILAYRKTGLVVVRIRSWGQSRSSTDLGEHTRGTNMLMNAANAGLARSGALQDTVRLWRSAN